VVKCYTKPTNLLSDVTKLCSPLGTQMTKHISLTALSVSHDKQLTHCQTNDNYIRAMTPSAL